MFFRKKKAKGYSCLQVVENQWEGGQSRQRVLGILGRLDHLKGSGRLDALLMSGTRYSETLLALSAFREGRLREISKKMIGGPLLFERLWQESGCASVIRDYARSRRFWFDVAGGVCDRIAPDFESRIGSRL